MIRAQGLSKRFGRLVALDGVSLEFPPAAVTALVGPNGSGKTTIIKILLGLARPDAGEITVGEQRLNGDPRYRSAVGYMAQVAPFPENLTAAELFGMITQLRQAPTGPDPELMEAFGLAGEKDKPLRALSGGTRQKVNAVIAFSFRPRILILDEPTAGLDPVAAGILKRRILEERAGGATILITSHLLGEVEELADRVAFLLEGRVRFAGTQDELLGRTGEYRLERAVAAMMLQEGIR
jgi:Cu-processing system ATP-binding protein